jgi:hypothetical protein
MKQYLPVICKYTYRGFKYIFINILFVFCFYSALHGKETITASLNKNKVFVGDIINFNLKVHLPKNAQINAQQNFHFNDFDVISFRVKHIPDTSNDINSYELSFDIAAYKIGRLIINPVAIFYINPDGTNNLFFTPEERVEVESIIKSSKAVEIKDIKRLNKFKIKFLYKVLIVATSILFVLCVLYTIKSIAGYFKKSKQIEVDPKTKSLNALDDLYRQKKDLSTRNFYYRMSEILRTYIFEQYKLDATKMTTSEFFESVKLLVPREINVNDFKEYLKVFNLARYADFTPNGIEIENNYNFTKRLLELL